LKAPPMSPLQNLQEKTHALQNAAHPDL